MKTDIAFIDGKTASFDETADVKMTPHGIEILHRDQDEQVRVLFPWARIFENLGYQAVVEMAIFIGILLVGLLYAWRKGVLRWA